MREEIGGERYVAGKWLLFALFRDQSDKVEAKKLVGVSEIVRGEENGGLVPRSRVDVSGRLVVGMVIGAAHNSENILFAVSASYTGFFSGRGPAAMTLNPIILNVLLSVHASGRSS